MNLDEKVFEKAEQLTSYQMKPEWNDTSQEVRFGGKCWKCEEGFFEYNGMLNLVCSNCGYTSGGCFT